MNIDIKLHRNDLPDDLKLGNVIAVDGEFMGLDVRRDPLCLIQISSGKSDAHIIQFDRKNYKAPNLVKILADSSITKIFHYGRADMAHIKYYLKTETKNILDTKIASKLARSYTDNHSLKALIKEFFTISNILFLSRSSKFVLSEFKYLISSKISIEVIISLLTLKRILFSKANKEFSEIKI